jgi:hypothetical protein
MLSWSDSIDFPPSAVDPAKVPVRTLSKMKLVLRDARIKPVANEMELHPHFQQPEFFQYLVDNGVQPIGRMFGFQQGTLMRLNALNRARRSFDDGHSTK